MDITIKDAQTIVVHPAHMGKAFYHSNMPTALRAAQSYAGVEGSVYSLPELANLRVQGRLPFDKWFTANTEELVGKSRGGSELVAVAHGGAFLTRDPARIEVAYKTGLINGAAKIDNAEFQALVDCGQHFDGSDAKLYRLSELQSGRTNWSDLPYDAIILADKIDLAKLPSSVQEIAQLKDNPLVHMRLLGPQRAAEYLDAAEAAYKVSKIGNWHPFANVDAEKTQGRVVFLGNYDGNGLGGDYGLYNLGRFVGVAPEVQGDSARRGAQNLEAELRSVLSPELGSAHLDRVLERVLATQLKYGTQE